MSLITRASAAGLKAPEETPVARPSASPATAELTSKMQQWLNGSGTLPYRRSEIRSAAWHVLRQRRFLVYFAGSLVSNLGTWLQNTAQMLLAYQLTHSAFAVGLITCVQFSGFLLLGPWAGVLADRLGSKRVLIATQIVSAAVAGAMAYVHSIGALTEGPLMIGALGIGLAFTFAVPLQTAMVPRLVPEADVRDAMAMNSVCYNAGRTAAPVLCVVVLASLGAGWVFALNAFSFALFAAAVVAVHPGGTPSPKRQAHNWMGLRMVLRYPRIWLLLAMVAAVTFADDPVLVLGPALSHQVLAVSSAWPAYFLSALGLGTVLGALVPTKPSTSRRAAMPLLVLAVSVIVFTSGGSPLLSLAAALVAGVAGLLTGAAAQALLLKKAGPQQAAQVMALWAVAWAGSKPVASLVDGWLASHLSVFYAGLLLATPALLVAGLELWLPAQRRERVRGRAKVFAQAL
jgi:MFS family permease